MWLIVLLAGIDLEADAGFGGEALPDSWVRVSALLTVKDRPFDGALRIGVRAGARTLLTWRRPLEGLPQGKRRLVFDFFATGSETAVDLEVVDPERSVRKSSIALKFLENAENPILVVGNPPGWLRFPGKGALFQPLVTSPEALPGKLHPLLGFRSIVFVEPFELAEEQALALSGWVESGGRLVVAVGPEHAKVRQGIFQELSPIRFRRARTARVETPRGIEEIPLATGELARGAFLPLVGGVPLGARARAGGGEAVFLASRLDVPGLLAALPPKELWRTIEGRSAEEGEEIEKRREETTLVEVTAWSLARSLIPETVRLGLRPLVLGGATLCLYVLWIGPLDYLRLRRRGRLRRGWISFAAAVALVSGFFWGWSRLFHPYGTRLVHVAFLDEGRMTAVSSLTVDRGGTYAIEGDPPVNPVQSPYAESRFFPLLAGKADHPRLFSLPVPARATVFLASTRPEDPSLRVSARWKDRDQGLVQIRNEGRLRLRRCAVVADERVHPLEDLRPFQAMEAVLKPAEGKALADWLEALDGKRRERGRGWGWVWVQQPNLEQAAPENIAFAASFLSRYYRTIQAGHFRYRLAVPGIDLSDRIDRGEAYFIGAFDEDATDLTLKARGEVTVRGVVRARVR